MAGVRASGAKGREFADRELLARLLLSSRGMRCAMLFLGASLFPSLVCVCSIARAEPIAVARSHAPLRLLATLHPADRLLARALIRTPSGPVLLARGRVWRQWKVIAIASGRVLLWRRGSTKLEYLAFGDEGEVSREGRASRGAASRWPGITQLGPRRFRLSRQALVDALARPRRHMRGLRVVPDARGGLALRSLSPDHALSALGLRVNDRLLAINGRRLRGVHDALVAYRALQHARYLELGVSRAGKSLALQLELQ